MLGVFFASGVVFYIMEKIQQRKIEDAERQFQWTMKSRGLSTEILEDRDGNDKK
jgi:hypothetical protein